MRSGVDYSGGHGTAHSVAATPAWLRALHVRSEAYNSAYVPHGKVPGVPAPPPVRKTVVAAPPVDPNADITSQINNIINPQVQGLQAAKAAQDKTNLDYQKSMAGYYQALGSILQGMAPATSAAYNSAASTMGTLGQGLTGNARALEDAQNAQDQKLLALGGQGQASGYVAGHAAPGEAALNPFYETTGKIPGDVFAQTGAAKAAEAAQQPMIWAARGRDALTEAIAKAVAGDQAYQDKIANIYAQVPALRDKIMSQVQAQEQATRDYNLKVREVKDTEGQLASQNQARSANISLQISKLQADIEHWNMESQNKALDRQARLQAAAQARQAQRDLVILRGQQARITKKTPGAPGSGKSPTDAWPKTAASIERQAKYLHDHPVKPATKDAFGKVTAPPVYPPSQTIFNSLWSAYVSPYLQSVPANQQASARTQAKRAVLNAMAAAGFPLPGRK